MKWVRSLSTALVAGCCLLWASTASAQQVTLSENHISLEKVFKKITDQTGYKFIFRDEWLKQTKSVSISVKDASIKQVLDVCFADQPFTYEIVDKIVVVRERPAPAASPSSAANAAPELLEAHGKVVDSTGVPLVGASVHIKGTSKGVVSDVHGDFELKGLDPGTVIIVSFTGYESKEFVVSAKGPAYHYMILHNSQSEMDAMVIQAYGTTSKRFNVGSIASVDASTIEKQPVTNVLLALQGQAPGLAVNASSGVPGSSVQLQVRGQNTLLANAAGYGALSLKPYDQPLFIIDGVPFAPQNGVVSQLLSLASSSSFNGGISQNTGISAFNGINPADIQSISILKDADATSIYGTQGSNGVILITTKKGRPGKTSFNIAVNTGFNSPAHLAKLMNTPQYLQMRKDAFAADGLTPSNNPYDQAYAPDLLIFDQNRYTNWGKTIFGKTSNNTDVHASLTGGTINNTFLFSGGYSRSDFNFPGSFSDQRLTLHNAYHHLSTDDRLTMDFVVDYSYDQNNSVTLGGGGSTLLPPNMPALLDSAGNLLWDYKGVSMSGYQFYAYLKEPTNLQTYNLNTSLRLGYKIMTGLTFTANLGYNRNTNNEYSENPAAAQDPTYFIRKASFAQNNFQTVNIEPQLDYNTIIGRGALSVLVGGTYKKATNYSTQQQGQGYANDNLLGSIDGAPTVYASDNSSLYKYAAGFGRIKYIYNQRYIVSLSGRRDGSSNFGPGRQFGNFGSVGAGWIFSEEKAIKSNLHFLSFGKLSGSYGTSGSDGIAPYQFQPFWQPLSYIPAFQSIAPNLPLNLYNPDYSWATKKSLNLSLDLGFFRDRILLNTTFYQDREGNQLGGYPLAIQSGFSTVLQNLPANIQNRGWEFALNTRNVVTKNFNWSSNFNLTFNRNKLLSMPGLAGSPYRTKYIIGQPTSLVFGFRYQGVDPSTGLFQFLDHTGHLTFNPQYDLPANGGDLYPIANREVKYMGGFGNTFSYKRVSLYVFFQFSSQTAPNYLMTVYNGGGPGEGTSNQPAALVGQYWKNAGDKAALQRLFVTSFDLSTFTQTNAAVAANNFAMSSGVYSNDTYMRLKTLSLSYSLPDTWLKRVHIQNCSVHVNAQNLLTFTNYKVADPETFNDYTTFPIQRIVEFGLNFNF